MSGSDVLDQLDQIAIIGLVCRFPGAKSVDDFWQNLQDGVESISFFSDQELEALGVDPVTLNAPNYVKAKPVLEDIELFDASFFKINPREARMMDPQHRLFLECAWEVLESAGYDSETYEGRIGVYAGVDINSYLLNNLLQSRDLIAPVNSLQNLMGNDKDYLSTRISYKLNLKGPSITVQTACSTSLVAVHLACESLLNGECDMALAGGIAADVPQKTGYFYDEGGVVSPDGHCRAFDARAQGTVFGSGVGIVVLKRLANALVDGDCIHAVIRGSAVNNDGSLKIGYTAPSVDGQAAVIAEALAVAGVEPEMVTYVETHGTGTELGDPIEIAALTRAFRLGTEKKGFCAIGSVKTNVGHLATAAGIAGLIKTVLALKHKRIPPSLHFEQPNPRIDFENSPFYVNATLSEWKADKTPRYAGVSSFGMGGTNVHVVLEEAPEIEPSSESRRYQLLLLSARTETALEEMMDNLSAHLEANPDLKLADVAYTLQVGRRAFEKRRIVVCEALGDATTILQERDPRRVLTGAQVKPSTSIAFMFSGQGAQYVHMGRDLYQHEALFREQVATCAELLKPHLELDLRDVLYPAQGDIKKATEQLNQTWLAQPALFAIEYALAQLWMSWDVKPQAMIGHSIGEIVVACLAGVLCLEDALALVAARGQLMQSMPPGSMLSVPLSEAAVQPLLTDSLAVATVNGPSRCVVAGPTEAIVALEQQLADEDVACRRLHTSHAFHSPMMDPILEPFEEQVSRIQLHAPQIPTISNVTGTWITPQEAVAPAYWAQHLRQTVRFSEGLSVLAQTPAQVLLEVGPGRTLRTLAQRHPNRALEQVVLSSMRHPHETQDDDAFLLYTLGQLWMSGVAIDWQAFYRDEGRRRVPLPTYPFAGQRYWIEPGKDETAPPPSLLKNPNVADWFYIPSWKRTMPPTRNPQEAGSRWLLFSNEGSLSTTLAQQLQAQGYRVVTVFAGDRFTANGDVYSVHPSHRDDYEALLAAVCEHEPLPAHIVHLWNVTPVAKDDAEATEETLQCSFYSLLFLAQAIGQQDRHEVSDEVHLVVVSNNVQQVSGEEGIRPEKATLLGPCKVIPQEMAHVTCRSIDIVLPEAGSRREAQLVEQIMAEVETNTSDSVIAYRGYDRVVQTYEAVQLGEVEGRTGHRLRERGIYVITGGLGGMGLALADYLARTVQARLVLTSRSRFPERERWEQWLATHDAQDRTSRRIRAVQELEALGAEVWVMQADVTDGEQMEAAVRAVCERFGPPHGVIHAAGVLKEEFLHLKTREGAARVLAPKVEGTRVLEAVVGDMGLDFVVLCSSLSAVAGRVGQVDYCAANAFLDAYATTACRGQSETMTVSVNWDAWADDVHDVYHHDLGQSPSTREGGEAFWRILGHNRLPQIAVCTRHLPTLIQRADELAQVHLVDEAAQVETAETRRLRPRLQSTYVAPRNDIEEKLAVIWQQLLGIAQVGVHDNFFELGGDSLLEIQIVARAREAGLYISSEQLFQKQTIAGLARALQPASVAEGEVRLPLTPYQQRLLAQGVHEPHVVVLEPEQRLDPDVLEQAIVLVCALYDALRLRFMPRDDGHWCQVFQDQPSASPVATIDLATLRSDEYDEAIITEVTRLRRGFGATEPPLLRAVYLQLGAGHPDRLLLAVTPLSADTAALPVLIKDLYTAYQQVTQATDVPLPPPTAMFADWVARVTEYAQSDEPQAQREYWRHIANQDIHPLPADQGDRDVSGTIQVVATRLAPEQTRQLLELPEMYYLQPEEAILTALTQVLARWCGHNTLLVGLGHDQRVDTFADVDTSRIVGCLRTEYLLHLDVSATDDLDAVLKGIKGQVRGVPHHGLGYSFLRAAAEIPVIQPQVTFSYHPPLSGRPFFRVVDAHISDDAGLYRRTDVPIHLSAGVIDGQLWLDWTYNAGLYRRATMTRLSHNLVAVLQTLILYCHESSTVPFTSSDFPEAGLDQKELDQFIAKLTKKPNAPAGPRPRLP